MMCGIFTKKVNAQDKDMEILFDKFFKMCKRIKANQIIFNTMSTFCDYKDKSLFYPKIDLITTLISKYWGFDPYNFKVTNKHLKYEFIWSFEI